MFEYDGFMSPTSVLQMATRALESAQALTTCEWDLLDDAEAPAVAEAISMARSQLDAALLRVTPRLDGSASLRDAGWASSKDFLTHIVGGHKGSGGGLVRLTEQLRDLPTVRAALEDGRVTLPQARVIAAKVATLPCVPEFQTEVAERMVDLVVDQGLDASDLGKAFDGVVADVDPDALLVNAERDRAKAERGAHQARFLSFSEDGHGGVRVKGYGTVEDVESIRATLLPLAAPVTTEPGACGGRQRHAGEPFFDQDGVSTRTPCPDPGCAHDGRDVRDSGARLWDALVDACDALRATETLPRDHGARARVMVTLDHDSLRRQAIDAGFASASETSTGAQLSASVVRRIACDAEIVPAVLGAESQVLDVGRARRLVTAAIWSALLVRDRHCAFPGCTRLPLACDAHHIVHWADGGDTSLDNMIMLCRHHHTLIHESPWTVRIDPETHRPVWIPPPKLRLSDLIGRATHLPARARRPAVGPHAA